MADAICNPGCTPNDPQSTDQWAMPPCVAPDCEGTNNGNGAAGAVTALNPLCVISSASGAVVQEILQEVVFDANGVRIGARFVDRVDGSPVSVPGGTHIGACPGGDTGDVAVTSVDLGTVVDAPYADVTGAADGTVIELLKGIYVQNAQVIALLTAIEANTASAP